MQKMKITLFVIILMAAFAMSYADTAELNYTSGDVTIGLICGDVGTNVEAPPMAPEGAFDARLFVNGVAYFEYYFNGDTTAIMEITTQAYVDGEVEQEITMDFVLTGYEVFYIGQDSIVVGGDPVDVTPGTITVDPEPIPPYVTQTIQLNPGWNCISYNIELEDSQVQAVFNELANPEGNEFIENVIEPGGLVAATYYTGFGWVGGDAVMNLGPGYWVKVNTSCQLELQGSIINSSEIDINLDPGWNCIGYLPTENRSVQDVFSLLANPDGNEFVENVIEPGGVVAATYYTGFGWVGGEAEMKPGAGYWVKTNNNCTLNY